MSTMNETAEMWRMYRQDLRARRAKRRTHNTPDVLALRDAGYTVREVSPFHFRVNDTLDLFPTNRRFHWLPTNRRGFYTSAAECCRQFLGVRPTGQRSMCDAAATEV